MHSYTIHTHPFFEPLKARIFRSEEKEKKKKNLEYGFG